MICKETDLKILYKLTSAINDHVEIDEICKVAAKVASELLTADGVELYCLDHAHKTLYLKGHNGLTPKIVGLGFTQMDEGLAGHTVKNKKPISILYSQTNTEKLGQLLLDASASSYIGIPLIRGKLTVGILGLYYKYEKELTNNDQILFEKIGNEIGKTIQKSIDYEQTAIRARRFLAISQAIAATRQLGKLENVLQNLSKVMVQSLGFDQSWIALVEKEEGVLEGKAGFGIRINKNIFTSKFPIVKDSKNPAIRTILDKKPVTYQFIEDIQEGLFKNWLKKTGSQGCLLVPIQKGKNILGIIGVFFVSDHAFVEEDIRTLNSVAEHTSIAIQNTKLYEEVKKSEDRYRTLFEAAGTSLVILDKNLTIRLVNNAFEKLSGYGREQLVDKISLVQFIDEKDIEDSKSYNGMKNPTQSWEIQFIDKDNIAKQVHITTRAIPGTANVLFSLIDRTQQRELERRLYRSEELAFIGELSAGIAHEIRNPLVAITNSVSLLKDEPHLTDEGKQLIDIVKEESDHLAAIVDDFLKFARPKKPQFEKEDINQLFKDAVKRCKEFEIKEIRWSETYDPSNPMVEVDRHQIQQVITNLFMNSIDAMNEGGKLSIQTNMLKDLDNEKLEIKITDTGIGIKKEEIPKIFQPFYSTKEKGTGMGLAICRRIIDNHNGEVFVESVIEEGTTFVLILPLQAEINIKK